MADTIFGILVSFGFLDAEYTLASIDKMRQGPEWAPVLAAMPEDSWCADPQELDRFYGRLADMRMKLKSERATDPRFISERMIGRLQECFLPLEVSFAA